MVSETVSYRYSCRRKKCRMIPLRETQWIICKPKHGGSKQMWFCPACGEEYTHNVKDLVGADSMGGRT